jgi:twitching motility protein PilI
MSMDADADTDPFSILREIEESCRICNTRDLRQSAEIFSEWSGIAFRVGGNNLLAPLDEVVEILDMPKLARVPLAQPWVRGIANIRGNLLPVVDFSGLLGGEVASLTEKTRVLVIDYDGIYSGLVVDEVYGLKHFMEGELAGDAPEVDGFLLPFIRNVYRRDGRVWHEFSMFVLADTPQFLKTAV